MAAARAISPPKAVATGLAGRCMGRQMVQARNSAKRFVRIRSISPGDSGSEMDASNLKTFAAGARLGGMNRAAAELHTVQSNVTARVQALEAEIGAPLFDRHSRGVSLTQ